MTTCQVTFKCFEHFSQEKRRLRTKGMESLFHTYETEVKTARNISQELEFLNIIFSNK